ncbi:hypothetical protein RJT34_31175 [Clitoria ternatea]|uniref:5' exonuclease Apollo n=1 Tax=Clitoria ternatea TaxID=43366 RepID=A0AAN9F1L7_CLITE
MEKGLVSVDRWAEGSQVYFLTHLHSDHTQGLSSTWSHGPLYCSPLTAKLLPFKFPDFNLSLLRILHVHTTSIITLPSTTILVTALDACHCPGSLMLLFRGDFGPVLYTGDFRWEPNCHKATLARNVLCHALHDIDGVDVVYLDNTYSNPIYDFPPRHAATQQIIDIIASHPDHDVIISFNNLGKEDLLVEISRVLKIKIWVWPERLRTMHLLGFRDIFTKDTLLTRVRAVPQYSFSIETLEALNRIKCPTIGIMPSGLPWMKKSLRKSEAKVDNQVGCIGSPEKIHQYIYTVPYSDHSNFEEMEDFIKLVQPNRLEGIVSSSSCYIEPMYYFGRLCRGNPPMRQLHNRLKRKESGTRVEAVSGKASFGGVNYESDRGKGKTSRRKFFGVRVSRFGLSRKKHRGARIQGFAKRKPTIQVRPSLDASSLTVGGEEDDARGVGSGSDLFSLAVGE